MSLPKVLLVTETSFANLPAINTCISNYCLVSSSSTTSWAEVLLRIYTTLLLLVKEKSYDNFSSHGIDYQLIEQLHLKASLCWWYVYCLHLHCPFSIFCGCCCSWLEVASFVLMSECYCRGPPPPLYLILSDTFPHPTAFPPPLYTL